MTDRNRLRVCLGLLTTLLAALALGPPSAAAAAESAAPGWEVTARNFPTYLAPGHVGGIRIEVFDIGAGSSSGPVTVTDRLPRGITALEAGDAGGRTRHNPEGFLIEHERWQCTGNGEGEAQVEGATIVTCVDEAGFLGGAGMGLQTDQLAIKVKVAQGAKEDLQEPEDNRVTVAGGGAPNPASTRDPIVISSQPAPFGVSDFDVWFSNADGTLDTQAGSHPYAATFSLGFNTDLEAMGEPREAGAGGNVARNIELALPPGFVGDPTAVPQCSRQEFIGEKCPAASEVGIIDVELYFDLGFEVYNLVPPAGTPAEFGFHYNGVAVYIDTAVRSGSDYGITSIVPNAPQRETHHSVLILWGYPEERSHDLWRGFNFSGEPCSSETGQCAPVENGTPKPFLTLPTACDGPSAFSLRVNSWEHPEMVGEQGFQWHDSNDEPAGLSGCEHLGFGPSIVTAPDTSNSDTPAGLTVEVKPPVGGLSEQGGLSTSDIQNTTVTLPQGIAINPGQAAGLVACPETEETLKRNNDPPVCPNASKVGTAEIETPLLQQPLRGNVYILNGNPPDLQLLLAASGEGVNVKLIGQVHLTETGQLVTTFAHTPELPFTSLKLAFSGGAQAALATPTTCGIYETTSEFNPWSSPFIGDVFPSSQFAISSGTNGAPCPFSPLPYAPQMIAGATTDQAGGYTNFSLLLQVPDDQQRTSRLQFKTPEGLLGMISKVPLCTNAQAEANTCPEASQIGHTVVQSGPGPYPLVVPQPGQPPAPIYLTEGYDGGSYGLSIVVPLKVGPFELPTQRVRAKIEVDPLTTQLTITTNPLPQVVAGVPTDLRTIDAVIDKPGFMFNPTGCSPRSFHGTAYGTEGAQAPIESHFQMGSCRALKFKPDFKVTTSAHTSRANGANLDVKVVYPTSALGANQASSQSNIKSIKVELPKRLPSRLTTLQKACTAAQFNANPAGCPAASVVGQATAITPVLPIPLSGPAYFVSNGNESFPNLIIVLQGYGVTVHLVGDTFISKQGITSSTFKQVPDVPIASFELNLPQGPYSALAANGNLCKAKLKMPTDFLAQNGAELHQNTPIAVTGCPKHRAKKASHKAPHKKGNKVGHRKRGKR